MFTIYILFKLRKNTLNFLVSEVSEKIYDIKFFFYKEEACKNERFFNIHTTLFINPNLTVLSKYL